MREFHDRATARTRRDFNGNLWRSLWRTLVGGASILTLSAVSGSLWAQPAAWPTKPVRMVVGFAPGGGIGVTAMYIVARPDIKARNAKELVDYAKANPGKLSYTSSGAGTPAHLAAELFKLRAGIFATHIPYRGSAPALQDVMAGQADYVFDPGIAFPHIRSSTRRDTC